MHFQLTITEQCRPSTLPAHLPVTNAPFLICFFYLTMNAKSELFDNKDPYLFINKCFLSNFS